MCAKGQGEAPSNLEEFWGNREKDLGVIVQPPSPCPRSRGYSKKRRMFFLSPSQPLRNQPFCGYSVPWGTFYLEIVAC